MLNNKIKISVAVIVSSLDNVWFREEAKKFHCVGDDLREGENSLFCAKRVVMEQVGKIVDSLRYVTVLELPHAQVHEICFIYLLENIDEVSKSFGLKKVSKKEIKKINVYPEVLKSLVLKEPRDYQSHILLEDVPFGVL